MLLYLFSQVFLLCQKKLPDDLPVFTALTVPRHSPAFTRPLFHHNLRLPVSPARPAELANLPGERTHEFCTAFSRIFHYFPAFWGMLASIFMFIHFNIHIQSQGGAYNKSSMSIWPSFKLTSCRHGVAVHNAAFSKCRKPQGGSKLETQEVVPQFVGKAGGFKHFLCSIMLYMG